MKRIKLTDHIEILNFTVRTYNCLKKAGIHTIEDILNYPQDQFKHIQRMGKQSQQEVMNFINEIYMRTDTYDMTDLDTFFLDKQADIKTFLGEDGIVYNDIKIDEQLLNVRSANVLREYGFQYVSEILNISYEKLLSMKHMGRKSADLIWDFLNEVQFQPNKQYLSKMSEEEKLLRTIAKEIAESLDISIVVIMNIIDERKFSQSNGTEETWIVSIFEETDIKNRSKEIIYKHVRLENGANKEELLSLFPVRINMMQMIEKWLMELSMDNKIKVKGDFVYPNYISVLAYIQRMEDEKKKDILLRRLHGETLETIGHQYGMTRERVRQICMKEIRRFPRTKEENYLYCMQRYNFSLNDFLLAFDETESTYYFLNIIDTAKKHKKPLKEALKDDHICEEMKKKISRAVYKHDIIINGVYIKKRKSELVKYFIRTNCKDAVHFDTFMQGYKDFLKENQLDESFMIEQRTYENYFATSDNVLWKTGKYLRYYHMESTDFTELLDGLHLDEYENVVITSLKLFKENPALMHKFDIRDEFELHNLLKKICKSSRYAHINFSRMPTIVFGDGNREKQIFELMVHHAPVSKSDLADLCEEVYGFKQSTLLGNCFRHLEDYFYDGAYRIDANPMAADMIDAMKTLLTDEAYTIQEVREVFDKYYPDGGKQFISSYNLRQLGFKMYSGYIVKDTYAHFSEYLDTVILAQDLIDITSLKKRFFVSTFGAYIQKLKSQRRIIEYLPNKFMNIRYLQKDGVDKKELEDFCDQVIHMIDKNEFFTITSLRNKGFTHALDRLGLNDYFYTSVLIEDERFSNRRMGKTKLLFYGKKSIELIHLILVILKENEMIVMNDLVELLEKQYGIFMNRDKLKVMIKDSDLYYDDITNVVYKDYPTYAKKNLKGMDIIAVKL